MFRRLDALFREHRARFQAIDLRWWIGAEAARQQMTVGICREEIRRCRERTPRPNFLATRLAGFGSVLVVGVGGGRSTFERMARPLAFRRAAEGGFISQPSQVYFPPEKDVEEGKMGKVSEEERKSVIRMLKRMFQP